MITLQQSPGGVIDTGYGEMIPDFGWQRAQLGAGEFGLRLEYEEDSFPIPIRTCTGLGAIVLRALRQKL